MVQIKAGELKNLLSLISGSVQQRTLLPILGHFCFVDNVAYTYDDIVAVGSKVPKPLRDLNASVPFTAFNVLKGLPSDITIEVIKEDSSIIFKSRRMRLVLPSLSPDQYIFDHSIFLGKDKDGEVYNADSWIKNFEVVTNCVTPNPSVPLFTAAVLVTSSGKFELYCTDDVTITKQQLKGKPITKSGEFVLPYQVCKGLVTVSKLGGGTEIRLSKSSLLANIDAKHFVFSKLLRIKNLPDLGSIVTEYSANKKLYSEISPMFKSCMARAKAVSGGVEAVAGKETSVNIQVKEGRATLSMSGHYGDWTEQVKVSNAKSSIAIKVDLGLLARAVAMFDKVCFESEKAIVFSNDSFTSSHVVQTIQN